MDDGRSICAVKYSSPVPFREGEESGVLVRRGTQRSIKYPVRREIRELGSSYHRVEPTAISQTSEKNLDSRALHVFPFSQFMT